MKIASGPTRREEISDETKISGDSDRRGALRPLSLTRWIRATTSRKFAPFPRSKQSSGCRHRPSFTEKFDFSPQLGPISSGVSYDFAPHLYLYSTDTLDPITPVIFVANSTLPWAHDQGCAWADISTNPNSADLAAGIYHHYELFHAAGNCSQPHESTQWRSNGYTSINETNTFYTSPRPEYGEGFLLQLDNSWRDGDGFAGDEDVFVRQSMAEHWAQYWYNFGNSSNAWGTGHEGDWEHIAIRFNSSNTAPLEVEYSYHHLKCTLPWSDVPRGSGSRPIVLIANGSHGSYPPGATTYSKDGTPSSTDKINMGVYWNSQPNLHSVADAAWYPFKGSWGDRWTSLDDTHNFNQETYDFGPSSPGTWREAPPFTAGRCAGL